MGSQGTTEVISQEEWLRPVEDKLQHAIRKAFRSAGPRGRGGCLVTHGGNSLTEYPQF